MDELEKEYLELNSIDKALIEFLYLDKPLKIKQEEADSLKVLVNIRMIEIRNTLKALKST